MSYTIRALSFDADNCLFHMGYEPSWDEIRSGNCQQVLTKNQTLLNTLKTQNSNFKETIVLVGSLRQSAHIDRMNADDGQTELFFLAIQKVANYLEATLDKFLTADIYASVKPGTSFDHAINAPLERQNPCVEDSSKLSLLYAQIHKLANQHPNESILFEFYDDHGCGVWDIEEDVLEKLQAYFTQYPEMLPSNVTLRLNHYEGEAVTPYQDIQGTGLIDKNYQETTRAIAAPSSRTWLPLTRITPSSLPSRQLFAPTASEFRLSDFPHFLSLLHGEDTTPTNNIYRGHVI